MKAIYHCKGLFFGIPPMKEEPRENVLSRFRCVLGSGSLMLHVSFKYCAVKLLEMRDDVYKLLRNSTGEDSSGRELSAAG